HLGADARLHFALASAVLTLLGFAACRWVPDLQPAADEEPPPRFALPPRSALLIGAVGFCAVFAEGASLDWSAVFLRDRLDSSAGLAAATTTGFMLTMAVVRIAGDAVVNRFGAVRTVRAGGVLAVLGGLLVVLAGHPAVAMAGFALMGLGIAVVVPLCFAAAGHSGPNPSQAIAGVATITYTSGLIAPSLIGGVAQATSLMVSFCVVTTLACGLAAFAGVLRTAERGSRAEVSPRAAAAPGPRP
ncbi:MFS transporter, partial [Streptomyces sp. SID2955]|nr:MFS transporter [Streptomyces sp. SID2955]